MVQDPTQFDVLVMPNLYGDILRFVDLPVFGPTRIFPSMYLLMPHRYGDIQRFVDVPVCRPTHVYLFADLQLYTYLYISFYDVHFCVTC